LVAQTCNLSYLEWEIGRIKVQGQPGQKKKKVPILTNKLGMVASIILVTLEVTGRRILV
jgi:hypothetical protein